MGVGVTVGSFREISVEGMNNGVLLLFVCAGSCPLANARSAGVGKDTGPDLMECVNKSIPLNGIPDLL